MNGFGQTGGIPPFIPIWILPAVPGRPDLEKRTGNLPESLSALIDASSEEECLRLYDKMIADMEVEGLSKAEKVITENYENGSDCGERNKICIGFTC